MRAATAGLARHHEEPLRREADRAARQIKELGDVQNWAEMLELDLVKLEECVRIVEEEKTQTETTARTTTNKTKDDDGGQVARANGHGS